MLRMDLTEFKCHYEDCGLILEKPVKLLCGNTLCRDHLDGFFTKFKCNFCHKQHSIPEDGFFVNEEIEQKVESFYQSDPLRKEIKESFNKLNGIINEYDKIDPDGYISNHIGDILETVVCHRDEMIEEIHNKSEQMIKQLKEKEQKCILNAIKLEKMNLNHLKDLSSNKFTKIRLFKDLSSNKFTKIRLFKDLSSNKFTKIRLFRNETKKFKKNILMNEAIFFEKYEKSSSFGKLSFYSNKYSELSKDCGKLMKKFGGYYNHETFQSIEVDKEKKNLLCITKNGTIEIRNSKRSQSLTQTLEIYNRNKYKRVLKLSRDTLITVSECNTIALFKPFPFPSYEDEGGILYKFKEIDSFPSNCNITSVCLISESSIAFGSFRGSISIWHIRGGIDRLYEGKSFEAHDNDAIRHLLLVDKTKLISYSGKKDDKIKIWDLETYEKINEIDSYFSSIDYLESTSDGILLGISNKRTVKIWQIETGKMLKSLQFEFDVSCSKILNDELIALGLRNGEIKIYNFIKMDTIKTVLTDQSYINHLCLLSHGNLLCESHGEVKYWKIFDEILDESEVNYKPEVQYSHHQMTHQEFLRKKNKLKDDYEQIDAESYIFDYIYDFINKIDLHRENLIKEINDMSNEMIKLLKEKEDKCKSNLAKLEKVSLKQLISHDLEHWKHSLRITYLEQNELKDILSKLKDKIKQVQNETKNYTNDLLMNETIHFEKYKKSSSFGKLSFYTNK
jgi:WD40 repeat protein